MMQQPHNAGSAGPRSTASLADMVAAPEGPSFRDSFPPATWAKAGVLAALFVAMNFWQFRVLVTTWRHDANWSHGFLIPLFSLYLLYSRRDELAAAKRRTCAWGLPVMVLGVVVGVLSYYPGLNFWGCHMSMIVVLFGMVLYLGGWDLMHVVWLPIVYLVFAMPVSQSLYGKVALPLQNFAARASTFILRVFGAGIGVKASRLAVTGLSGEEYTLTVAEACSGVRSLMAYVALSVAWAYLEDRPLWQRGILVAAAVPVAILCNILRVTITCLMYVIDRPELGQKFMHEFLGMAMLIPALGILWLLSRLLQSLIVEEDSGDDAAETPDAEGAAG